MNIDGKVKALIDQWESGTYCGGAVQKKAALHVAIVTALKEQDRDTRHACAEAVIQLPRCLTANDNSIYNHRIEVCDAIDVDAAHAACMNARAV